MVCSKMNIKISSAVVCMLIKLVSSVRIPPNPCPQTFSYYKDSNGVVYGDAIIPYDKSTIMHFSVNASLAALFRKAELRLLLVTAIEELETAERVIYNVFFPSQQIIPKITQITYNGVIYCQGPPEPLIPGASGVTNIWYTTIFQYTRRTPSIPIIIQVYEDPGISDTEIPVKDPNSYRPVSQLPDRVPIIPRPAQNVNIAKPVDYPEAGQNSYIRPPVEKPHISSHRPQTGTSGLPGVTEDPSKYPTANSLVGVDFLDPITKAPMKTNDDYKCGVSNNVIVPLILGGTMVEDGQFPWLTAVFTLSNQGKYDYKCSATLISEKHVVTAGRCVQYYKIQVVKTKDILLVMGTSDLKQWSSNGAITRRARMVQTHPDFKKKPHSAHADISVITMDMPVQYSDVLRPACLWNGDSDLYPITNMMGIVAGFGQDEDAQNAGNHHVMKAKYTELLIVSQSDCLLSNIAFSDVTSDKTFCAGGNGGGPCIGDSGAGFFITIEGVHYLRGVASLSASHNGTCDFEKKYAVFCDVAKFMDWIKYSMTSFSVFERFG